MVEEIVHEPKRARGQPMDTAAFLRHILPHSGTYVIAELVDAVERDTGKPYTFWKHLEFDSISTAAAAVAQLDAAGKTVYHACNSFAGWYTDAKGKDRIRTQENVAVCRSLYDDIDVAKPGCYATRKEAGAALKDFIAEIQLLPTIVRSGHGLHLYWPLSEDIMAAEWLRLSQLKRAVTEHFGLKVDRAADIDSARVLRPVGSHNRKNGEAIEVSVASVAGPYSLQQVEKAFLAYARKHNVLVLPPAPMAKSSGFDDLSGGVEYPPSSAHLVAEKCAQLGHFKDTGSSTEPQWHACLGVVKHCTEGEPLAHEWSKGHPDYDYAETQGKLDGWAAGPTTCAKFRALAPDLCHGCSHNVTSPIWLGVEAAPNEAVSDKIAVALLAFNKRYFVGRINGNVYVFDRHDVAILAGGMTFTAFRQLHAGHAVDGANIAAKWLNWPERLTYQSIIFDPSGHDAPDAYNTWRGLNVIPAAGGCGRILTHILEVWCGDDVAQFNYVILWMALLVQRPWEKPDVALVLRSRQGSGKTIIVQILLKIFGAHGFTAAQKDQVAGRFNGHLFDKVLVVLEEAFFAGDPAAVAATNALVTNATLGYEAKGKDSFSGTNHAHVISLTNHSWAIPAGEDARRWMVLDVSDKRKGDYAYFGALQAEIENGGTEAFLHHLVGIDVAGWNPRLLPDSHALRAQQVETLMRTDPVAAWWLHVLAEGAFTVEGGAIDWTDEIPAGDMQESYTRCTARARSAPSWDGAAKRLRQLLPAGELGRVRKSMGGTRPFYYRLPDLHEARAHFQAVTGVNPCEA